MKITISYMSQLKKAAGTSRESLDVDTGTTLQDFLLRTICPRYEGIARAILEEGKAFRSVLLVFVGDKQADMETPQSLKDGDEITLMLPIAGG